MGELLWEPAPDAWGRTRIGRFFDWVHATRGLAFEDYAAAWRWSVSDPSAFWWAVWEHFELEARVHPSAMLVGESMPGAHWLPGARLNYARHALRHTAARADEPAVVGVSQTRGQRALSWGQLWAQVGAAEAGLRRLGVGPGDRVVGYLPNVPETVVALLACASIGAVWSSCAPEFGTRAVVDRVAQIEPKVLLAVDGYRHGDKTVDRADEVAAIREALPSLQATVLLGYLDPRADPSRFPGAVPFEDLVAEPGEPTFEPVAADHPLYVLYSSGTTGLPKAIVHGHGGILLEHVKMLGLHHDLGAGDRFFWFTTTGWMMWNYLVSGLLVDATVVCFDGDPGHPDLDTLWRLADEQDVTCFGVSAPYLMACRRAGLRPGDDHRLEALDSIGSTGAPLPAEGFAWVYDAVSQDVLLGSASGGTDLCTAFVGPCPLLPVRAGQLQARALGAAVEAFDEQGEPVIGQRGELVITAPMPSMPVGLWGDGDGSCYREAYFDHFPGVWRHGDWIEITEHGSCVITGRSDATLNRGGVRMGTAEFYAIVEDVDGVADSLVVHLDEPGVDRLVLFIVPTAEADGDELRARLVAAVRTQVSPRHVPDEIRQVADIPRTISGKKMEVPVKRLLQGEPVEQVANPGAMANPDSLAAFTAD